MKPITVVVPVLRRPHHAAPFMDSLSKASDGLIQGVLAIANFSDHVTATAWGDAGADVLTYRSLPGTFAQKANLAVAHVGSPWMFLTGDDVVFHEGWAETALEAANGTRACVVGTNDLGADAVRSGQHATHMLIAMDYIHAVGASWDGPGIVAHEGYNHWFVDNEIVTAAKQRDVWVAATGAVVEHMHPYFGQGQMDATYELGEARARQDGELWTRRCQIHAPELLEAPNAQ